IEARSPLSINDTIHYNMSKLAKKSYQLRFAPVNMQSTGFEAFLIDKYLKTNTPVSLSDSTFVNIAINADAASAAANRFYVIFRQVAVLPVTIVSVAAFEKNDNIVVKWKVASESNMRSYEIEKSMNGTSFTKAGKVEAKNQGAGEYQWTDESISQGYHYYRIRSVGIDGKTTITNVVKVLIENTNSGITVYPNPVVNGTINVQMTHEPAGNYSFRLMNNAGQVVYSKKADHSGGNGKVVLQPDQQLAKGIYQLEIVRAGGKLTVIKVYL